ncbi:hypothetical protein ACQPZ2_01460 [Nocardia pseudovaccinii]|uniref:hypothetical protein n=1 Tax=Nocardia pseudovaccinii TaxID=189540 RepID=UPI003D9391D0
MAGDTCCRPGEDREGVVWLLQVCPAGRGWAADLKEVIDRIGFDPLGEVAARLNPEKVWVLVIDGLRAGRHISVHPTRASADKAVTLLQEKDLATGASSMDITIDLVLRSPSGLEATAA